MSKAKAKPAQSLESLDRDLERAIYEQQQQVMGLHGLLICLDAGIDSASGIHEFDELSAIGALIRMADEIWKGLDGDTLRNRAKELRAERAEDERAAELEEEQRKAREKHQQEAKDRGALQ
jgi:hypothetical protein